MPSAQVPHDRLRVLQGLLESSLSNDAAARRAAEQKLSESIAWPDYAVGLLSLIASQSRRYDNARHAASVHFNNLLRLRWPKPSTFLSPDADHHLPLPDFECCFIRKNILDILLAASPPIQAQLGEAIAAIAATDFPSKWRSILPSIASSLGAALDAGDVARTNSLLVAAASLFSRFRDGSDFHNDLDYCIAQFADTLTRATDFAFKRIQKAATTGASPCDLRPVFKCLRLCSQVFYSLNSIRLHPRFQSDMSNWMDVFLHFLATIYPPSVEADGAPDLLRAAVCENLLLFAGKHEVEFGGYLKEFVNAVGRLPMAQAASRPRVQRSHLQLVTAVIRFLTTVSRGAHHAMLGGPEAVRQICDNVVFPNLQLQDEDIRLFGTNWIEFIRRDSEGSNTDTLRMAACQLLHGLSINYREQVAALVSAHVHEMFAAYTADRANNWKGMDAASYLVIALVQKPGAAAGGTPLFDTHSFFTSVIVPQLQAPDWHSEPMLKATLLRFLKEFSDQIPKDTALLLLPNVVRFLSHESNVVHSYAATFIENLLVIIDEVLVPGMNTVDRSHRYVAADINPLAPHVIQSLLTALSSPDLYENPYLMKCLMQVLGIANVDDHTVCAITSFLVDILVKMCNNPKNSDFNNCFFEALLTMVGRFGGLVLSGSLFTVLERIFCEDIWEFVPYACKIFAQLDLSKLLDQDHRKILSIFLSSAAWGRPPCVPACLCLLRAFLPKVSAQDSKLPVILPKFHHLLSRINTEETAFRFIGTLVEDIDHATMKPYIEDILLALFCRQETLLPTRGAVKFASSLIVFMSLLLVKYGFDVFESSVRILEAKGNAFSQFLKRFWIPNLALVKGGRDVKLTAVASIELLLKYRVLNGAIDMWGRLLNSTVIQLLRPDIQYAGMWEDLLLKHVDSIEFFGRSCELFSARFSGKFGFIISVYVHLPHRTSLIQLCAQRNITIS